MWAESIFWGELLTNNFDPHHLKKPPNVPISWPVHMYILHAKMLGEPMSQKLKTPDSEGLCGTTKTLQGNLVESTFCPEVAL